MWNTFVRKYSDYKEAHNSSTKLEYMQRKIFEEKKSIFEEKTRMDLI